MTHLEWLLALHKACSFISREKPDTGKASTSELRRWFKNKAIHIDGKAVDDMNSDVKFPINSCVLFPRGKRVTIF